MMGACTTCGADPGSEWDVCERCGARAGPVAVPERTIIEPNRGPAPRPAAEGERARLGTERNYYRPVSRES
ncbi:MAG TPA: hypothetical protein VN697_02430, partial [Tepidiformaceae bacterium]|nr:hypothetical protein [Tepidiformaceae bacterium]